MRAGMLHPSGLQEGLQAMRHLVALLLVGLLCAAVGEAQITCVSSCESSSEIAVVTNIRECCVGREGGGFLRGPGACSSCIPFRVVDPQISFRFDPESPIVGEPFIATCSAEISPEVMGSIQLQWRNEVGEVIAIGEGNDSAAVSFIIDNYSMEDGTVIGGYNCRAAIFAEDDMRTYEIVLGRNILFTSSSSSTSITSCGDFTQGSDFQLTCTVTGVTTHSPMIMWFGPPGRPISRANGVEIGDVVAMGDTYSRSIRFPSLSPQHTGRYVCMNSVTSRPTVEHQVFIADRSIITTDSARLGRPFAAQCGVTVPTELSATVQTVLLDPADTQLASDIGVSSAEAAFLLTTLQESNLGEYKCRTSVFSNRLNTPVMAEQSFSIDIERCATSLAKCARVTNSDCEDRAEGPVCTCRFGFLKVMSRCMNMNECRMNQDNCSTNAQCVDTPGSFRCTCRAGYAGGGVQCSDINECTEGASACGPSELCVNTDGSFVCVSVEPPQAEPVNECEVGPCDPNAVCTDTVQSFSCTCNEGYTGNGTVCSDIDECGMGVDDCDPNADCINLQGAYLCHCLEGYFGTGYTCKQFEEEPTTMAAPETTVVTTPEPTIVPPVSDEPTMCVETAPQDTAPHPHHYHHSRSRHTRRTHTRHRSSHHTHTRHRSSHHTHTRHRSSHHTHTRHRSSHHTHTRSKPPPIQQSPCVNNPINEEPDATTRTTRTHTRRRTNTLSTTRIRNVAQDEALETTTRSRRISNRMSGSGSAGRRSRTRGRTNGRQTFLPASGAPPIQDTPLAGESADTERTRHRTRSRGRTRTRGGSRYQQALQPQGAADASTPRRKSKKGGRGRG